MAFKRIQCRISINLANNQLNVLEKDGADIKYFQTMFIVFVILK